MGAPTWKNMDEVADFRELYDVGSLASIAIQSQYAASPTMVKLAGSFQDTMDASSDLDTIYNCLFWLPTCTGVVDINHQRSACKIHLVTLIHKFLLSIVRDFIFCVPHGTLLSLYDINNLINISTVWRITETTEKFMLFLPTYPFQRSRGSLPYRLLPKSNDRVSVITYTEKAERRCNRQTPLTSQHYFLKPSFSINARYLSISFFFR